MSDVAALPSRQPNRMWAVVILILLEAALVISWSAGFVGIRFAIDHAPLFLILFWRSLVSGLILLPFALTVGPKIRLQDAVPPAEAQPGGRHAGASKPLDPVPVGGSDLRALCLA